MKYIDKYRLSLRKQSFVKDFFQTNAMEEIPFKGIQNQWKVHPEIFAYTWCQTPEMYVIISSRYEHYPNQNNNFENS